jgi:hypothetical protein
MVWAGLRASGVVGGVCQATFRRSCGLSSDRRCGCVNGCRLRSSYCSARRRLQEVETVLNDTWYSRDLPVLTAIAEKLERGSAPVDTEQLIDELGLTRQDLTAALRALDVEYLIVKWPERITYRRSDPSTLVERITARAREAVGLWPSTEALRLRNGGRVMIKNEAPARYRSAARGACRKRNGLRAWHRLERAPY